MNMLDFGAFQEKMHIPSRAKFILHILFGEFQVPVPSWNLVPHGLEHGYPPNFEKEHARIISSQPLLNENDHEMSSVDACKRS